MYVFEVVCGSSGEAMTTGPVVAEEKPRRDVLAIRISGTSDDIALISAVPLIA